MEIETLTFDCRELLGIGTPILDRNAIVVLLVDSLYSPRTGGLPRRNKEWLRDKEPLEQWMIAAKPYR
jgi:hypothetical protein